MASIQIDGLGPTPGPTAARRRRRRVKALTVSGFLMPFFVPFALFYLLPVAYAFVQSLQRIEREPGMFGKSYPVFAGLSQYASVLGDREFLASVGRMLLFGIVQVPLMLGLALVIALLLDSQLVKGKAFFRIAAFMPYAVPGVIAAIVWSFIYHPQLSPIVSILNAIGVEPDFLGPSMILWSIANVSTWLWTGYNMLIMFSALQAIPQELYEAARMDGANAWRIAWNIKIPLIGPAIVMTGVFSIIGTLQLYTEPTVLQQVSPTISSTYTPNMMAFMLASANNYPKAAAMSIVIAVAAFVLSFVFMKTTQGKAEA